MSVFVVALPAEARPLIDAFKLKRQVDKPWQLYSGHEHQLLITGMGKLNAAAGCAWLIGRQPKLYRVPWVNLGIAGHRHHSVGSLHWVERLHTDTDHLYPSLHFRHDIPGASLRSVDRACSDYPEADLVDMEGLGFYLSCSRFVPLELLQLLKIVSDNPHQPHQQVNKSQVISLIQDKLPDIIRFVSALEGLSEHLPEESPASIETALAAYQAHWRFSHSQLQQLRKLLLRHYALSATLPTADSLVSQSQNAKHTLQLLQAELHGLPVNMP